MPLYFPWLKIRFNLEIPQVYFSFLIVTQAWLKFFPPFHYLSTFLMKSMEIEARYLCSNDYLTQFLCKTKFYVFWIIWSLYIPQVNLLVVNRLSLPVLFHHLPSVDTGEDSSFQETTKHFSCITGTVSASAVLIKLCHMITWSSALDTCLSEIELLKRSPFTIASKRIKYQRILLTKEVKNLWSENYKKLLKEIEDNTNKWKVFHASKLEKLILLKCPFSNQSNLQIQCSPYQNSNGVFHSTEKIQL